MIEYKRIVCLKKTRKSQKHKEICMPLQSSPTKIIISHPTEVNKCFQQIHHGFPCVYYIWAKHCSKFIVLSSEGSTISILINILIRWCHHIHINRQTYYWSLYEKVLMIKKCNSFYINHQKKELWHDQRAHSLLALIEQWKIITIQLVQLFVKVQNYIILQKKCK